MKKDRTYLYEMYNATSTEDGTTGELETYEAWLEKQLLSRIENIEELEFQLNKKRIVCYLGKVVSPELTIALTNMAEKMDNVTFIAASPDQTIDTIIAHDGVEHLTTMDKSIELTNPYEDMSEEFFPAQSARKKQKKQYKKPSKYQ
jgi:hypothetical protein